MAPSISWTVYMRNFVQEWGILGMNKSLHSTEYCGMGLHIHAIDFLLHEGPHE